MQGPIIFSSIIVIGLLAMVLLRRDSVDQLARLTKQSRRMAEKMRDNADPESIFVDQKTDYLSTLLARAGLEAQYDKMRMQWLYSAIGAGALGALGFILNGLPEMSPIGFFLGVPMGAAGFVFYIGEIAKKRQAKMTEQLPQILETMVSALRAGSPVMEVFKVISDTGPDPIKSEFKRGLISLQLGKPFRDVMKEMSLRIKAPDFKLLTQAIFISQDVGGNLADVVATIAEAIRERFKLRDFLNALTSQGKATATFIGCLPYLITVGTYFLTPSYMTPFLNHPIARIVMVGLVMWELLGFYILRRMVTFEV
ncbi:MAG TPA: type II secretion system F family protein [Candidatus Obscuribacter sp.]|nr:type II secretion system F family protein [Candidatus Obscuribacter sp.]HMX44473.1 type II secretion system F family protein [Candidatus Obscuribacter sp.]HMY04894.1 type II secretion system F family protein [Candidatus Obscuribacter sp.]HMY53872.1 type II secretion system F family protein [Candidatus Obscuribacter sp.]HNA71868.1 type II secretion system F family protein [Candidatus Obscuribacter sp.]